MNDIVEVSICLPAYNQTKYLVKTLDSIVLQTFQNFELIISDDSTTDDVESIVNTYINKFTLTVHYVRNNPSLGSPANWNRAISYAQGKWIKIMHHDDWFCEQTALEKIIKNAQNHPNALIFAGIKGDIIQEKRSYVNLPSKQKINELKNDPFSLIWANIIGPPSAILYPKSTIQFDTNLVWLVDIEFYLQLLLKKNLELVYIEEVLFENCQDDHNITNSCFQNKQLELKEFNYIFNKFYPNSSLINRLKFMSLLKTHISSYSKINNLELLYAQLINKPK